MAAALTAAVVLSPTAIHAGRPLDTEDTGTVEPGAGEVETGLDLSRQGGTSAFGSRLVLSLGVAPHLEVRAEAAVVALDHPGEASRAGFGDSLVGLKYRLLDESVGTPAVLVAAAARLPTGDAGRGLGEPAPAVITLAAVSRTLGTVTLTANAGYVFEVSARAHDTVIAALAAEQRIGPRWTVVAEVFARLGVWGADDRVIARAGATWHLLERVRVDGAVGTGLGRHGADLLSTLGATFRF